MSVWADASAPATIANSAAVRNRPDIGTSSLRIGQIIRRHPVQPEVRNEEQTAAGDECDIRRLAIELADLPGLAGAADVEDASAAHVGDD